MTTLPPELLSHYRQILAEENVPFPQRSYYCRWLNLFHTECFQKSLNPRTSTSQDAFIANIRQRHPSEFLIGQARHAIALAARLPGQGSVSQHANGHSATPKSEDFEAQDLNRQLALIAGRMKARRQRTIEELIADGQDLRRAKALLPHGQFTDWIKREFDMSSVSAQRIMHVAEAFEDKIITVKHLSKRALYELAAPSTSSKLRARILTELETGKQISYERIRELKLADQKPRLPRPEQSLSRTMGELAQQLARWNQRTRRQIAHYRLHFDEAERKQIDVLKTQLEQLSALLLELSEPPVEQLAR